MRSNQYRRQSDGVPVPFIIGCILAAGISVFIINKYMRQPQQVDEFQFRLLNDPTAVETPHQPPPADLQHNTADEEFAALMDIYNRPVDSGNDKPMNLDGALRVDSRPTRTTQTQQQQQRTKPDDTDTASSTDTAPETRREDRVLSAKNFTDYHYFGYGIHHPERKDEYHLEIKLLGVDRNQWPQCRDTWILHRDRASVSTASGTRYRCLRMLYEFRGNEVTVSMIFIVPRTARITRLHIENRTWPITNVTMGN